MEMNNSKNKKVKRFLKRYVFNKGALILSVLLFIASIVLLGVISYDINRNEQSTKNENIQTDSQSNLDYYVIKDICLVISSIFGTNLMVSLIIEKSNKNAMFREFFENEIISNSTFYDCLNEENAKKMLSGLELSRHYANNKIALEICDNFRNKITEKELKYYYSNLAYTIRVTDKGDYFEKKITREITINSIEDYQKIENYKILEMSFAELKSVKTFELQSVQVNGKVVNSEKYCKCEEHDISKTVGEKKDFNKQIRTYYKNKIKLYKNKPFKLSISMITRCPKDDITSTFRVAVPCKNFRISYIINSNNYRLVVSTFNSCEGAVDVSDKRYPNEINVSIDGWVVPENGVIVTIVPKSE
ncbi:MAG: hypothetical protein IJG23_03540 [Clostridia bacterium]|nr:hypothetical protein [Clostridia bacterium]